MSKKFVIAAIAAAVILGAIIIVDPDNKDVQNIPESAPVDASTASSRIDYFAAHGWEVEELSGKDITIPSDFSESYEQYAALQDKQGMPLREYAGKSGKLYVYEVKNYSPNNKKMLAEIIVCDDTAIASLVYSDNGDGTQMSVN